MPSLALSLQLPVTAIPILLSISQCMAETPLTEENRRRSVLASPTPVKEKGIRSFRVLDLKGSYTSMCSILLSRLPTMTTMVISQIRMRLRWSQTGPSSSVKVPTKTIIRLAIFRQTMTL